MNPSLEDEFAQLKMDPNELYREETFTDRKIGTIRCVIPVTADGSDDPSRVTSYVGQTQVMTPAGALPISFEIEAENVGDAASQFAEGAKAAIEKTMKELEEMRREAASSIVVPGQGGGMGGMGGGGIQMP
jgi:hypothetical protein